MKDSAAASTQNELISPLFPYYGDEGEKKVLARDVAKISLMWLKPGVTNGRPRRVAIPTRLFERLNENGDLVQFVMDPFTTTEEEIEEWFGGGEYWLQALDANNAFIHGRNISFTSPKKDHEHMGRRAQGRMFRPEYEEEDDDMEEDELPRRARQEAPRENPMTEVLKMQREMFSQQQKNTTDQVGMVQKMADNTIQHALGSRQNESAQVEALRRQLEDISRDHREEMRRKDRENDEDRSRLRTEIDSLRKRNEDDVRELRVRYDRDLDDLKKRYERDISHEIDRYESKYKALEKEYTEYKDRTRKELHELEKENLELSKDLANIPDEKEDKNPPKLPEGMPWWAALGAEILRNPPKLPILQQPVQQAQIQQQPLTPQQMAQTPPPAPSPYVVAQQQAAYAQAQQQQAQAQFIPQQSAPVVVQSNSPVNRVDYIGPDANSQPAATPTVSTPTAESTSPFELKASMTFDNEMGDDEGDEEEQDDDIDETGDDNEASQQA